MTPVPRVCLVAVRVIFAFAVGLAYILQAEPGKLPINWDDANPYHAVVTRYLALPNEQRMALEDWASPDESGEGATVKLTSHQQQIVADLVTAVRLAAEDPRDAKWRMTANPSDPDNPAGLKAEYIAPLRQLQFKRRRQHPAPTRLTVMWP